MGTNPKKVVGYIRSAVGGLEGDRSAVAQKAVMQGFADQSGSQVVEWYVDVGCSGNNMDRPACSASSMQLSLMRGRLMRCWW